MREISVTEHLFLSTRISKGVAEPILNDMWDPFHAEALEAAMYGREGKDRDRSSEAVRKNVPQVTCVPTGKQLENAAAHSDKADKLMLIANCLCFHFFASQMQRRLLLCHYIQEDFFLTQLINLLQCKHRKLYTYLFYAKLTTEFLGYLLMLLTYILSKVWKLNTNSVRIFSLSLHSSTSSLENTNTALGKWKAVTWAHDCFHLLSGHRPLPWCRNVNQKSTVGPHASQAPSSSARTFPLHS